MSYIMEGACRSFDPDNYVCRDGFIQKLFCRGQGGMCNCGNIIPQYAPNCLKDNPNIYHLNGDGSPKYYTELHHDQ